jgi:hypothetical protein
MSFNREVNYKCEQRLLELKESLGTEKYRSILLNGYFAGGLFTSIIKQEKIKDFDLFWENPESLKNIVEYYLGYFPNNRLQLNFVKDPVNPNLWRGELSHAGGRDLEQAIENFNSAFGKVTSNPLKPQYLSKNALMLSNGVQIVFRFVGKPEEVFTTFDYEHCKVYWRPEPLGLTLGKTYFKGLSQESLSRNELIYTGNTRFVLSAISRLNKFISRGWGIAPSSLLSIALSSSKVAWDNKEALREELLGIYGIDNKVLNTILDMCSIDNKVDLDKIVKILGEV